MRVVSVTIVAMLVGILAIALVVPLARPAGSRGPVPLPTLVHLTNDTAGVVGVTVRCPQLLRRYDVCEFRDLPVLGTVPPGAAVILPPQPPPGEVTWFRVTDAAGAVLGCVPLPWPAPDKPTDVAVSRLAPCPDWRTIP